MGTKEKQRGSAWAVAALWRVVSCASESDRAKTMKEFHCFGDAALQAAPSVITHSDAHGLIAKAQSSRGSATASVRRAASTRGRKEEDGVNDAAPGRQRYHRRGTRSNAGWEPSAGLANDAPVKIFRSGEVFQRKHSCGVVENILLRSLQETREKSKDFPITKSVLIKKAFSIYFCFASRK